jgi:hypothetical protein
VENAKRSRRGLATLASAAHADVHWDDLETQLRRTNSGRVRRALALALIGPLAVALSVWGLTPPGERLLVLLADVAIVGSVIAFRIASAVRTSRRIAGMSERADLFAAHRTEVVREIRRTTRARWVALAVVIVTLGCAVLLPGLSLGGRLVYVALGAIVTTAWAERLLVRLPRLRLELEALDRGAE